MTQKTPFYERYAVGQIKKVPFQHYLRNTCVSLLPDALADTTTTERQYEVSLQYGLLILAMDGELVDILPPDPDWLATPAAKLIVATIERARAPLVTNGLMSLVTRWAAQHNADVLKKAGITVI